MATGRFNPHGDVLHAIEGRCLISRVSGSWNMEMHAHANAAAAPFIDALIATGKWASVVEVKDTLVAGLEVLQHGRQQVIDTKNSLQLVSVAWVIKPSVEGYKLLLGRYAALYEGVLPTAVFSTMEEALEWSEGQVRLARQ